VDIVEQESDLLSPFTLDGARKKAIVPVKLPLVMILGPTPIALPLTAEVTGLWTRI
jgi:hypothetical protein